MKITLPSGNTVELADRYKGSLVGKVTGAVFVRSGDDGKVLLGGDTRVRQTDAFLRETITAWSFEGIPIPKLPGPGGQDRTDVIADTLDLDDYNALHEQVQPLVLKVVGGARPNQQSTSEPSPKSLPS